MEADYTRSTEARLVLVRDTLRPLRPLRSPGLSSLANKVRSRGASLPA